MAVVTYKQLPLGSGLGGDVSGLTSADSAIIRPFTGEVLLVGQAAGKGGGSSCSMLRFEIDKPAGTVFLGGRVSHYVFVSAGASTTLEFGVLKDDGSKWVDPIGFAHASYVTSGDLPRPHTPTDAFTVFYGDNNHTVVVDPTDYGANDRYAVGTGTLSGEVDFAALLADIQGSFDDLESLRDTGVGNGIPIAFAFSKDNLGTVGQFDFYDVAKDALYVPTLELEFVDPVQPDPVSVREPRSSLAVSARMGSTRVVEARANSSQLVTGRVGSTHAVSCRARTTEAVSGRAGSS